jgi:hypothetical protein
MELVVIEGAAGTVTVTGELLVASATDFAVTVTVWDDAVAAGAVYVTELVVMFDSVPPPLTDHATPATFLSCATVAVRLTEFVPSTVLEDAVADTLIGAEDPPQPERLKAANIVKKARHNGTLIRRPEKAGRFASTIPPKLWNGYLECNRRLRRRYRQ